MGDTSALDPTHDPSRRSWVASARRAGHDFPLQNLPFGVFRRRGSHEPFRGGVAIGDEIVDLAALRESGLIPEAAAAAASAAAESTLNRLMAEGPRAWHLLRQALFGALVDGAPQAPRVERCLVPQQEAELALPARIGDYTDFYSSIHHASAVGRLFRPDQPLTPNYKWLPIGYHGRCSSIGVSEQRFHRPSGQRVPPGAKEPIVGPTLRLDYELELGAYIGASNALGTPIPVDAAEEHVFGLCLLNDWSARDLQTFEYQPLGPFLAKSFATTVSPWIVTLEALAPFRLAPPARASGDPLLPPYLTPTAQGTTAAIDIMLEVALETQSMRRRGEAPQRLTRTSYRHAYWTLAQLVAHHTSNGCNLEPGDLLGTGTQSGPDPTEGGSLLELTRGGTQSVHLADGEQRTFLEDGDAVILRGWCERAGAVRIGFGEARGRVLPALERARDASGHSTRPSLPLRPSPRRDS